MLKPKKHHINNINKIISILMVLILISTVLLPTVSSIGVKLKSNEKEENKLLNKISTKGSFKEKIRQILEKTRERFQQIKELLKNKEIVAKLKEKLQNIKSNKNTEENTKTSLQTQTINSLTTISRILSASSTLSVHTNYKGVEKDTSLRLFAPTRVDVDGDGDKDISARILLYPSIVKPLALAINFRLTIQRLNGFNDNNADFEAYAEFHYPGVISPDQKDERVRFGYISEDGDEVPDSCSVIYKFVPYLLYKEKAEHRLAVDTKINSDDSKLTLIYSTTNTLLPNVTERRCEISYDPVIDSEVTFVNNETSDGMGFKIESSDESDVSFYFTLKMVDGSSSGFGVYINDLGKKEEFKCSLNVEPLSEGTKFEYEKISESNVDVILFIKNGLVQQALNKIFNTSYSANFYIKYVPDHFSFTSDLIGLEGGIELNRYDERIEEIGWCDNLFDKKQWICINDMASERRINWDLHALDGGLDIFVDSVGASVTAHALGSDGGTFDLNVRSNSNLSCLVDWDLESGYFRMTRNQIDLDFSVDVTGGNGGKFILEGSMPQFNLPNDKPFEANFGSLSSGSISDGVVVNSGVSVEISKLYLLIKDRYGREIPMVGETGTLDNLFIDDLEFDARDISFSIGDGYIGGSFAIQPIFPELLGDVLDYVLDEEQLNDPFFNSTYFRIAFSGRCSVSVGRCNIDIVTEYLPSPNVNITNLVDYEIVDGVVTIQGTSSPGDDGHDIEFVQISTGVCIDESRGQYDFGPWETVNGISSWSYNWNTIGLRDDLYGIKVRCYDGVTYGTKLVKVYVENLEDPTIQINYPAQNQVFTTPGIVTIQGNAYAGAFALKLVEIIVDDGLKDVHCWDSSGNSTSFEPWTFDWDISLIPNGKYYITATVIDVEGYSQSYTIDVTVNKDALYNPPTARIDHPSFQSPLLPIYSDVITVEGSASPGYFTRPVELVQIRFIPLIKSLINGSSSYITENFPWINVTDHNSDWSYWSYGWDTSNIPIGAYKIQARSYDGVYYSREYVDPEEADFVGVIVKNIDFIDNSIKIDIYRGAECSVDLSDLSVNWEKTDENDNPAFLHFSIGSFDWNSSDKSSHLSAVFDKENKSFVINRDKHGGSLELRNIFFQLENFKLFEQPVDFVISIQKLVFDASDSHDGEATAQVNRDFDGSGNLSVGCHIRLFDGIELYGFYIKIGNWSWGKPDLVLIGPCTFDADLEISIQNVYWDIAQDLSHGWIKIESDGHLFVNCDIEINGEGVGLSVVINGMIYFQSGADVAILSWDRTQDVKHLVLDFKGCAGLNGFHLVVGDFVDWKAPYFIASGGFYLNATGNQSEYDIELQLLIDEVSYNGGGFELDVEKIFDFFDVDSLFGLSCSYIYVEMDASFSGYLDIVANKSGLKSIECKDLDGESALSGYFRMDDFYFDVPSGGYLSIRQIEAYGRFQLFVDHINGGIDTIISGSGGLDAGGSFGLEFSGLYLASSIYISVSSFSTSASGSAGGSIIAHISKTLNIETLSGSGSVGGDLEYLSLNVDNVLVQTPDVTFRLGSVSFTGSGGFCLSAEASSGISFSGSGSGGVVFSLYGIYLSAPNLYLSVGSFSAGGSGAISGSVSATGAIHLGGGGGGFLTVTNFAFSMPNLYAEFSHLSFAASAGGEASVIITPTGIGGSGFVSVSFELNNLLVNTQLKGIPISLGWRSISLGGSLDGFGAVLTSQSTSALHVGVGLTGGVTLNDFFLNAALSNNKLFIDASLFGSLSVNGGLEFEVRTNNFLKVGLNGVFDLRALLHIDANIPNAVAVDIGFNNAHLDGDFELNIQQTGSDVTGITIGSNGIHGSLTVPLYISVDDAEVFSTSSGSFDMSGYLIVDQMEYDSNGPTQFRINIDDFTIDTDFNLFGIGIRSGYFHLDGYLFVNLKDKYFELEGTGSHDVELEFNGLYVIDRYASRTNSLNGSIMVDWSDGVCISVTVDEATRIRNMSLDIASYYDKYVINNWDIQPGSTAVLHLTSEERSLRLNGYFYIDTYKHIEGVVERTKIRNLGVGGDFFIEKLGDKEFFMESESGFGMSCVGTFVKFNDLDLGLGFAIQGDVTFKLGDSSYRHSTNGFTGDLLLIINEIHRIELINISSNAGYFDAEWDLDGDLDGFIRIDSSALNIGGTITYTVNDQFGIKSHLSGSFNADDFEVSWDPPILDLRNWNRDGSISGDNAVFSVTNVGPDGTWYKVYPYLGADEPNALPTAEADIVDAEIDSTASIATEDDPVIVFRCDKSHDNDEDNWKIDKIRWDCDNDGEWDTPYTLLSGHWVDFDEYKDSFVFSYEDEFEDDDDDDDGNNDGMLTSAADDIIDSSIRAKLIRAKLEVKDDEGDIDTDYVQVTIQYGEDDSGYIQGTVQDDDTLDTISGATVTITSDSYSDSDTTGSNGQYSFTVEPGVYVVSVSHDYYEDDFETVEVTDGETIMVDFNLVPTSSINHPPTLTEAQVDPESGSTSTTFVYLVTYEDVDGDEPTVHNVYIDGAECEMSKFYWSEGDSFYGVYQYLTTLSSTPNPHSYYFVFNDGQGNVVTTDPVSSPTIIDNQPPVLSSASVSPSNGDEDQSFTYSVTYSDVDGDSPDLKKHVYIKPPSYSEYYEMDPMTSHHAGIIDGVLYTVYKYTINLYDAFADTGEYCYYFEFDDGHGHTTRYPSTGYDSGPSVYGEGNEPPEAYISVYGPSGFMGYSSTINGEVGVTYTFKAYGQNGNSNDPDGDIVQYLWSREISCFLAGTQIAMADGTYKNIEDLVEDDEILSYDEENQKTTKSFVSETYKHTYEEMSDHYLILNKVLKVTPQHLVFANDEWMPAGDLKIGDVLQNINGEKIKITSIEKIFETTTTYNLEVDTYHTFYAENLLVHNAKHQPNYYWQNTGGSIPNRSWSWSEEGNYEVKLGVKDDDGLTDYDYVYMEIDSGSSPSD